MSNLVETFLDKLIFPSLSGKESPIPKNLSGSQHLVGNNVKMDSALISEFHEMLNSDYCATQPSMNMFSGGKNFNPNFDTSNFLVSRVSKLFLPSLVPFQELHLLSAQAEYMLAPETQLTRRCSILSEIIDQIDLFVNKGYNIKTMPKAEDLPCTPEMPQSFPVITDQTIDVLSPSVVLPKVAVTPPVPCNTQKMNQELVNRKAKKMSKQSKKRRRRQKKNKANSSPRVKELSSSDPVSGERTDASQGSASQSVGDSRDIFCDIISMTGQILPEVTSFLISVEGVVDDDTDWDACSDSDWLDDCPEFEVTGLFVSNLAAPSFVSCPVKKVSSCLEVPPIYEDKETLKLKNLLLRVNKAWEESTRDLTKQKLPSKVSFAPDKELVQAYEVDNYERKGEWEIYAHERMRFKRRITELESVISPCLNKNHREKVFQNLHKCKL